MLVAFALPSLSLAAGVNTPTVPQAFRGEWNNDINDCSAGLNDTHLKIGVSTISYYESSGKVRAVVLRGAFEIAMDLELSGEGESWVARVQYKLSADGNRLTDITRGRSGLVRYRCPAR
jgi:hypothetical protein